MKLLRNPEIQVEFILLGVLTVLSIFFMGTWLGWYPAVAVGAVCLVFIIIIYCMDKKRYQYVSSLGEQLDQVLHGEDISLLENCDEGDLAVLSTQVIKIVRNLREHQSMVQREKTLLADSMADISHQMKTPLTSIHLLLSFLQEEELTFQRRIELVKKIMALTERMDWMVYALLRMAKLEAGTVVFHKHYISIQKLIKECYESLAIPMDLRNITFRSEIGEKVGMVGDMAWMTEAVTNVVKNCMEHTPEGGEVFVMADENPLYTEILVQDTGKGIDEEDLPHIFERFYRGKDAGESSVGIGLALSRQIITSQNGTIKAYNKRKGEGAVFEIRCYKGTV